MLLFVAMVVVAVAAAAAATAGSRQRQRSATTLGAASAAFWLLVAGVVALRNGLSLAMVLLVGASLAHAVQGLTRRLMRASRLHWSAVVAAGVAATALEGYWVDLHFGSNGGVFADLSALAGFAVLATATVAGAGVGALALYSQTVRPVEEPDVGTRLTESLDYGE